MDLEKRGQSQGARRDAEGCLVVAIRIPVRIVVLVLVVPVRVVWDGLVVVGRVLRDSVLRPVGRGLAWAGKAVFVWPVVGLWRYVVVPVGTGLGWLGRVLVVVPALWLYRNVLVAFGHGVVWVLAPVGRGAMWVLRGIGTGIAALGAGVAWLTRCLVVVPAGWLYAWVLAPVGRGIAWCARGAWRGIAFVAAGVWRGVVLLGTGVWLALYWTVRVLLVLPLVALWRWVLAPVGRVLGVVAREVGDALGHAWRIAGWVSLAVWRFLVGVFRWVFVEPVRWVYTTVLTPVGHVVRDAVLRPAAEAARSVGRVTRQVLASARETVRQTRADLRRTLFGAPPEREAVARREPGGGEGRTLGRSTTALTKD
ncbi:hypothetical protein PV682_29735 [Streptomyces niveiscabiei]|uniref:hypothetical protein n=1 Tax=Streptomyces niveiscabiei TaxID=164115 RepID=UPI0029B3B1E3|nr:hypothetical protein [Streptomyces niveiscabiei]MDX3385613.1 hypothetical protein [Streptomyces niveiscabiei]